jgi:hypothetical protein
MKPVCGDSFNAKEEEPLGKEQIGREMTICYKNAKGNETRG